jgi:Skp family chaperone for outer membrane proteins
VRRFRVAVRGDFWQHENMKTLLSVIGVGLFAVAYSLNVSGQAPAATPVGYVSTQKVLADSNEGKAAVARLQAVQQQKANELRPKQQALEATRRQLLETTDQAARTQLSQTEQQQRTEFERLSAQATTDVQALQRQMQAELQLRVRGIIEEIAKSKNVQMVVNADTTVIWSDSRLDLTPALIERLNAPAAPRR